MVLKELLQSKKFKEFVQECIGVKNIEKYPTTLPIQYWEDYRRYLNAEGKEKEILKKVLSMVNRLTGRDMTI